MHGIRCSATARATSHSRQPMVITLILTPPPTPSPQQVMHTQLDKPLNHLPLAPSFPPFSKFFLPYTSACRWLAVPARGFTPVVRRKRCPRDPLSNCSHLHLRRPNCQSGCCIMPDRRRSLLGMFVHELIESPLPLCEEGSIPNYHCCDGRLRCVPCIPPMAYLHPHEQT